MASASGVPLLALFLAVLPIPLVHIYTSRLFRYVEMYCRCLSSELDLARMGSVRFVATLTMMSSLAPFMYVVMHVTKRVVAETMELNSIESYLTIVVAMVVLHLLLATAFH